MTSTFVEVERAPKAAARHRFHRARIAAAPDLRKREHQTIAWLRAELANGADLDAVLDFLDGLNAKATR